MNVTFLVGNGFDINLGLHTGYQDFYPYFLSHASENNMIKKWISKDIELWSDLEERLGVELQNLLSDEKDQFIQDKAEMDTLLSDYLEQEQDRFDCEKQKSEVVKEMVRSMINMADGLSLRDQQDLNLVFSQHSKEHHTYKFLLFNYTNTLDKIVDAVREKNAVFGTHASPSGDRQNKMGSVLHIHGTTDDEMIVGVNDPGQINNLWLQNDEDFLDTIVKSRMNEGIGQGKTEKGYEIIKGSRVIYIFGMSLGNTDKCWWEEIIRWLVSDENNKLIFNTVDYAKQLAKNLPAIRIRLNKQLKREVFEKGIGIYTDQDYEKIKNQIMIVYNAKIFNFSKVKDEKEK